MTREARDEPGDWLARPRIDSELATAHILAEFQRKKSQRGASPACTPDCRTQLSESCVEECEIPCTSDCTDQCVVVCEEPHGGDDGLCCDLQNACDSSDCQYAYLDESCCWGCPTDQYPYGQPAQNARYTNNAFDLADFSSYQQQHLMENHISMTPQVTFHRSHMSVGHSDNRRACYHPLAFTHCAMPCPITSTNHYENSPIPSLVQSAGESPWSMHSSLSGSSAAQFTTSGHINTDNPLNILADYSTTDLTFFTSPTTASSTSRIREEHNSTQAFEIMMGSSGPLPDKLGAEANQYVHSDSEAFPKLEDDSDSKDATADLQCRWLLTDSSTAKLCGGVYTSREDLHRHIIEDHVKSMKKRGVPASSLNPVCCWHGCESARKKKIFKLQHLKDHIVCHSKLRMKCEICGKECRDAKVLKLHLNTHRPGQEKPFRCDFEGCTASFGTSALLSSHKRVHTGEKPHKCAWCDYRAADKGNLRRHEEEMHMGKKWPCPYCSQQLAKKANLTRHIRDLHANEAYERGHLGIRGHV